MRTSQAWVELALRMLSCNQRDLARRVGVSPTQITKWKNGEHMSFDMENKFRTIVELDEEGHPEFVLWAGSPEDADKWDRLIHFLADAAMENAETGYNTLPLLDELAPGLLCVEVSDTLEAMGVEPPKGFPPELEPHFTDAADDEADGAGEADEAEERWEKRLEERWELLERNPYSATIRAMFESLNNVYGFYAAYIDGVLDDDDDGESLFDTKTQIEDCLMSLAACKIEVDEKFAPRFKTFRYRVLKDYEEWLTTLKEAAFRAGTPLRAELLDLVNDDDEKLGHAAEAQAMGFNASRLHPDIYMNELLVGMRIIHQVLPAILKKLDINDFRLNESDLNMNKVAAFGRGALADAAVEATPDDEE